jgi:methionine biosynthesis protein MetW
MSKNYLKYYSGRFVCLCRYIFGKYPEQKIEKMDYDAYWRFRGDFGFSTRYAVFAALIEEKSSVLDIGCGEGSTLKYLSEKKHTQGAGIDISGEAVAKAKAKGIQAKVADVSAPGFGIDGQYDYIILSEVLEHIAHPEDLMEKVKGKFKIGLIVSMPNIGYYTHRLRLFFGHFPIQWQWHPGEHLRFWTIKDFRRFAKELGLEVGVMRTHTGFLFLHRLLPNLFADSAVFLLKESAQ